MEKYGLVHETSYRYNLLVSFAQLAHDSKFKTQKRHTKFNIDTDIVSMIVFEDMTSAMISY